MPLLLRGNTFGIVDLNIAQLWPSIQLTYTFILAVQQRKNTSVINGHLSVHIIPWSLCRTIPESPGNHVSYPTIARCLCGRLAQLYTVCSGWDIFIKRRLSVLTPNGRLEADGQRRQCCQCSSGTAQSVSKSTTSHVLSSCRKVAASNSQHNHSLLIVVSLVFSSEGGQRGEESERYLTSGQTSGCLGVVSVTSNLRTGIFNAGEGIWILYTP